MKFFVGELVGRRSVEGMQNVSGAESRRGARSGGLDLFDDPRVGKWRNAQPAHVGFKGLVGAGAPVSRTNAKDPESFT